MQMSQIVSFFPNRSNVSDSRFVQFLSSCMPGARKALHIPWLEASSKQWRCNATGPTPAPVFDRDAITLVGGSFGRTAVQCQLCLVRKCVWICELSERASERASLAGRARLCTAGGSRLSRGRRICFQRNDGGMVLPFKNPTYVNVKHAPSTCVSCMDRW